MYCDSLCVRQCVCPRAHAHASLDMQSGSLVLSEGSPSIWPSPVSPAAVFQQQFVAGANMRSITAHSLSPAMSRPPDWGEQWEAQLCKTSFHVISVSRVTLLGLGARLEMYAALILCGLSLPLAQFYPNPCLSLPNHLSLFAWLHLPAHCYSLLLATPFLVHFMFMWCAFHFFISVIRYRLPIPVLLSHCAMIAPMHL